MTHQEYLELKALYEKEGQQVYYSIAHVLRGTAFLERSTVIAASYVLLMANEDNTCLDSINAFCESINADDDREAFIEGCLGDVWQMVVGQKGRYTNNTLKSIILFAEDRNARFGDETKTPDSISRLAYQLFDLPDGAELADFCSGNCDFVTEAFLNNNTIDFHGIEINASIKEISAIRLEIMGCKISLEHENVFNLDETQHKYLNIFSNYPFKVRIRDLGFERNQLLQKISEIAPDIRKSTSSDWFFNAAIIECLKDNGKAIAVMTNGSTWNTLDKPARKFFVENGYIEAVIALPERMFDIFNIPVTMIIMSKNNKKTMLVDATQMCEKGRRFTTLTDKQIEKIFYAVKHKTANSVSVSQKDLIDNDYVINPTRYLTEDITVADGVPFGTIIKSITRGAPLRANELDQLVSDEPTDYQYLMLANIKNGQIDAELPYIKEIQENQQKYCLKNHSLILSKNGAPFKIAVAEVQPGKTVLANGNLFVIEIDEEKANPYFVKAFLESEKGLALLKSISVGATMPNISIESLKKISIPQPPLEEQNSMVTKYLAKLDEIALYQRKLQKAYEELKHFYDNKEE